MSPFRDELAAAHAKIQRLEIENSDLQRQLRIRKDEPPGHASSKGIMIGLLVLVGATLVLMAAVYFGVQPSSDPSPGAVLAEPMSDFNAAAVAEPEPVEKHMERKNVRTTHRHMLMYEHDPWAPAEPR